MNKMMKKLWAWGDESLLYIDQRGEFFHSGNSAMTGIGDNLKAQGLLSKVDEEEHPKRAPTAFIKL